MKNKKTNAPQEVEQETSNTAPVQEQGTPFDEQSTTGNGLSIEQNLKMAEIMHNLPDEVPPFLQRLLDEEKELSKKIDSLRNFLHSEKSSEVKGKSRELLKDQLVVMQRYQLILNRRIEILK